MGLSAGGGSEATVRSATIPRGVAITVGALGVCAAISIWHRRHRRKNRDQLARRTIVISSTDEWRLVADDFIREVTRLELLGLDCEWVMRSNKQTTDATEEVNRVKAVWKRNKVALLQLAPSERLRVLLRLDRMEIPPEVVSVLANHRVIKLGVAVLDDANKLREDYGIMVRGCLDLRYMASSRLVEMDESVKDFSLAGLAHRFAGIEMDKAAKLRCANWEAPTLSATEVEYAAMDAHAGLAVTLAILGEQKYGFWPFGSSYVSRCWEEFGIFVDIPFRRAALKKSSGGNNTGPHVQPKHGHDQKRRRTTAYAARKQQNVYKNSILEAPDGEVLCSTDELKLNWYLSMGLGEVVSENPFTVRLNFEPRCRAILGGEYYVDQKTNECVVCGQQDELLKKNVVAQQYRKLFPPIMKSHTSHDMVLLCIQCQLRYTRAETALMGRLDEECPTDIEMPNFKRVKAAAMGLLKAAEKLTPERKAMFEQIVREYLGLTDDASALTEEQLRSAGSVDVCQWLRENNATHGLRVVKRYGSKAGPGLFALEKLWRQHFLDTMKPKHLSAKWSIEHNHDAVLMKIATGRDLSGYAVEELLEMLGVSWDRMAALVEKILTEGLVTRERIVIWDLLDKHTKKLQVDG